MLFILVGLAQMLPSVGLILGLLAVSVLGSMDVVRSDHARRLMERGPRSSDNLVVALSFPMAFLRVGGKALLYGAAYLLGGILVGMIIGLLTDTFNPTYVGAYAVSIVVLLSFVGPNAAGARRQANSLLENIGISNFYVYIGLIVGVCLLAFGAVGIGITVAPDWRPIPDPGGWFG
ncbi:hypothetical protein J4H86_22965 [Spiractinospora alimapuensis]|nr:hypothetical protein J4H86_22965 [Spiractinospora alimapuensis]